MSEYVAIWLAGAVLLLVGFGVIALVLRLGRFRAAGRTELGDVFKVLVVVVALSCALYSLLTLLG